MSIYITRGNECLIIHPLVNLFIAGGRLMEDEGEKYNTPLGKHTCAIVRVQYSSPVGCKAAICRVNIAFVKYKTSLKATFGGRGVRSKILN